MISNNYLIELIVEDLPISDLLNIINTLKKEFISSFFKKKINVLSYKSFFTVRRIIFIFKLGIYNEDEIKTILTKIFRHIKFNVNMRWESNKETFVRPIRSYVLMCNDSLVKHTIFNINSVDYTYFHDFIKKEKIITILNYKNFLFKKCKIICSFYDRVKILKRKFLIQMNKHKSNILLNNNMLLEVANSFEYPMIDFVKIDLSNLKLPQRIVVITILKLGCVPLLYNNDKLCNFLIVLDSIKRKTTRSAYHFAIKNKLTDIDIMYSIAREKFSKINISIFKSTVLNKDYDNLYYKIKRVFFINKYLCKVLNVEKRILNKCIILINLEILSKFIFDNIYFSGLLFVNCVKNTKINDLLYDYNRVFFEMIPRSIYGSILFIIENIDYIVTMFLLNFKPRGKKDPYNFKKKINIIIKTIINNKISLNLYDLLCQSFLSHKMNKNCSQTKELFLFIIDKFKMFIKYKYIDFIKNKNDLYISYLIAIALNNFFKYEFKKDLFYSVKRVEKIITKNKTLFLQKIDCDILNNFDEFILLKKVLKQLKISRILRHNYLYFEDIKYLLFICNKLNSFFKNVFILCNDLKLKNNRIKLLCIINYYFNRTIYFNIHKMEF